jgi:hypothetical protein
MAKTLRHLGKARRLPASPQAATLDWVANPHPDTDYVARFTAPEFTTLCPIENRSSSRNRSSSILAASAMSAPSTRTAPSRLARNLLPCSSRNSCASAAIGIRAAAYRSTFSGRRAGYPQTCGCRIKGWPPIARAPRGATPQQRRRGACPSGAVHSITSSAGASGCAGSIPRALDVSGAPPLPFCSGDERVHDMPRKPQQPWTVPQPSMISRRNASLHLRLQNLPPHERYVTMPNGPPQ